MLRLSSNNKKVSEKMAGKRKNIDWEAIEREYVAGQLSNREIARAYDCGESSIRKKAAELGWERNLLKKVREKVRSKLVRSEVRTPKATEKEIVDEASDRGAEIILSQRKDISKLAEVETRLLDKLQENPTKTYVTSYQGEIIREEIPLNLLELTQAANNLSAVQQRRIQLQRQAYNLDDDFGQAVKDIVSKLTPDSRKLLAQAFEGNDDAGCGN
jgi:hypothetical protein